MNEIELKEDKGVELPLELEEISEKEYINIFEISILKAEIKRVNAILRETHNPREFKQNKAYLKRLERKLRTYGQT